MPRRPAVPTRPVGVCLGVSLAVALAGCANLPGDQPQTKAKPVAAYAAAQTFDSRADPNPAAGWPEDGWWRAYGDAQLDTLVDEALRGSPTLAQARARIEKARGEV